MVREVDAAMEAGAIGLSTGLIYAPGMHAGSEEVAALVAAATRHGGLYATHMRNESAGLFEALDEAVATARAAGDRTRLQVSHLKCGAPQVWGRAAEAVDVLDRARADGLDVAADQYPYTAAATTLATILPPALLGLGVEECVAALGDQEVRFRVLTEIERGSSGWENVASRTGLARHPGRVRREPPGLVRSVLRGARRGTRCPSGRPRVRRAHGRSAGRVSRHRLHDRARRRGDHGRALGRGLHGRGGASTRARRSSMPVGRIRARTGARPASWATTSGSEASSRSRPQWRS